MRRSSLVHLHAMGSAHRALLGRVREDDGQRESFWDLPEGELDCGTTEGLADPEIGFDPATQVLVAPELPAALAQKIGHDLGVEDAAWALSACPFFSIFVARGAGNRGAEDDVVPVSPQGQPAPPPPPAWAGGRSLPSHCLTPRLLAQRPQRARATRAGWL